MSEFFDAQIVKCPHCKTPFAHCEGPQCDCLEEWDEEKREEEESYE